MEFIDGIVMNLDKVEYIMSLQFLVDWGNWWGKMCVDSNGVWQQLADGSWECRLPYQDQNLLDLIGKMGWDK